MKLTPGTYVKQDGEGENRQLQLKKQNKLNSGRHWICAQLVGHVVSAEINFNTE